MSDRVLLLAVGVLREISIATAKVGAKELGWSDDRLVEVIDFAKQWKDQGATNRADIVRLQRDVRQQLERCVIRHPVGKVPDVVVASLAPISIMMEVGHFLRLNGYTVRVLDHNRDQDDWRWGAPCGLTLKGTAWSPELPSVVSASTKPITVVVSVSGIPAPLDIQAALGNAPDQVVHVCVDAPRRGVISCESEARQVAAAFRDVFDTMRTWFPLHDSVHAFLAVPPSVGVLLGASLQLTFGRNVTVYESVADGQVRRFIPGGNFLSERPLQESGDSINVRAVEAVAGELNAAVQAIATAAGNAGMSGWFPRLVSPQAAPHLAEHLQQANAFRRFDSLDPQEVANLQVVVSAQLTEFTWVSADHQLAILLIVLVANLV